MSTGGEEVMMSTRPTLLLQTRPPGRPVYTVLQLSQVQGELKNILTGKNIFESFTPPANFRVIINNLVSTENSDTGYC